MTNEEKLKIADEAFEALYAKLSEIDEDPQVIIAIEMQGGKGETLIGFNVNANPDKTYKMFEVFLKNRNIITSAIISAATKEVLTRAIEGIDDSHE